MTGLLIIQIFTQDRSAYYSNIYPGQVTLQTLSDELLKYILCNMWSTIIRFGTVKPLITNTSEEFIKCRLDKFSMSFIIYYVHFSICENK